MTHRYIQYVRILNFATVLQNGNIYNTVRRSQLDDCTLDLAISTGSLLQVNLCQKLLSTNPQYDYRLFIELRVQYMKIASSEHVVSINCFECQNKNNLSTQKVLGL